MGVGLDLKLYYLCPNRKIMVRRNGLTVDHVKFEVDGDPLAWARSRVDTRGRMRFFKTEEQEDWQNRIAAAAAAELRGRILRGPLVLLVRARLKRPMKHYLRGKLRADAPQPWECHTTRRDWDNIGKNVGDALNGEAYDDDRQIVQGFVSKEWADGRPGLTVEIARLAPPPIAPAAPPADPASRA